MSFEKGFMKTAKLKSAIKGALGGAALGTYAGIKLEKRQRKKFNEDVTDPSHPASPDHAAYVKGFRQTDAWKTK